MLNLYLQLLFLHTKMNYFPYLPSFKNTNFNHLTQSPPYTYPCPYFDLNQFAFVQSQYAPPIWNINHTSYENFKDQAQTEHSNDIFYKPISISAQQDSQIVEEIKNISNKQKKQKKVFKQKQGRNMISNLFRQALKSMLTDKDKTIETIQKISVKHQIQINSKQFLEGIAKKLKNLKNYVRIGQIESFLKGKDSEKSKDHAKVLRILVYNFLREDVIPCLSNNPKVQNNNRRCHIVQIRKFQELLIL